MLHIYMAGQECLPVSWESHADSRTDAVLGILVGGTGFLGIHMAVAERAHWEMPCLAGCRGSMNAFLLLHSIFWFSAREEE